MFTFVVIVHVLSCILLAVTVLMQSGRGGGLTDAFAAAESMFGAQTNSFLIRATTVLAIIFLCTSLSLAFLSAQKNKSLLMKAGAKQEEFDPDKLFDKAAENTQKIEINANAENAVNSSEATQ